MRRRGRDRGVATIYAVVVATVLLLTSGVVLAGIQLGRAQHQAAAAADLSALSAAMAVAAGGDACVAAGRIAMANGARLVSCTDDGTVVDVTVEVSSPSLWSRTWTLRETSRAGPAAAAHSLGVESK